MSENNDKKSEQSALEKSAVKTTIVGGRPPGSGKDVDKVPRGIEILVKKASVDPEFKEALLEERSAAAGRIELSLDPTEITILNSIPQQHLEGIIATTKVNPNIQQAFLCGTAAVMLAALTATSALGDDWGAATKGIRPDDSDGAMTLGIRPAIVEYENKTTHFIISPEDANLKTGILEIKAEDRLSGFPLRKVEVFFTKVDTQEANQTFTTNGKGYTGLDGVYRIEGVPIGKFMIEITSKEYFPQSESIDIIPSTVNVVRFLLDRKGQEATRGMTEWQGE